MTGEYRIFYIRRMYKDKQYWRHQVIFGSQDRREIFFYLDRRKKTGRKGITWIEELNRPAWTFYRKEINSGVQREVNCQS